MTTKTLRITSLTAEQSHRLAPDDRAAFERWMDAELPGWEEQKIYQIDFDEGHVTVHRYELPLRFDDSRSAAARQEPERRPVASVPPRCVLLASVSEDPGAEG